MKPSKACIEHCKKLLNPKHVFTKGEIQGINKMLNAMRFSREQGKVNGQTLIAALRLRATKDISQRITPEQTKQGLEYLKSIQLKRSNGFKKGSGFEHLNEYEAKVVKNAKSFRFIGFMASQNGMGEYCFSTPIYEIHSCCGTLSYSPVHWSPSAIFDKYQATFESVNESDITIEHLREFGIVK